MTSSDPPASSAQKNSRSTGETSRTWRLARKELREILRDRRTVITLVLMPLLVYPLLGVIMRKGVLSNLSLGAAEVHVGLETEEQQELFLLAMWSGRNLLEEDFSPGLQPEDRADLVEGLRFEDESKSGFRLFLASPEISASTMLKEGVTDLTITMSPHPDVDPKAEGLPFLKWEIQTRSNSALAKRGLEVIEDRLRAINNDFTAKLLTQNGLSRIKPAEYSISVMETDKGVSPLVTFIPLMLVLMTMTGAVYPAIDLTAGERERGTMEILVAAPVSRLTLLSGKFLAVLTVALLTATMNLLSMFVTLFALGLSGTVLGNVGPTMVVQVVVLMAVFAAFFSAVLLSITSLARSFKEAQAYLIPLMLMALTPGVFSLMPDLKINGLIAVVPLVNAVLMGRDLLVGDVNLPMFAVVLISTALYGLLALSLAARVFGSDAVLSNSGSSWNELFRRPKEVRAIPSIPTAMLSLAIIFPLFIIAGSAPSAISEDLKTLLLMSGCVSIVVFMLVPILVVRINAVALGTGFKLKRPHWMAWPGAALAGLTLWAFMYEVNLLILTQERIEYLTELMGKTRISLQEQPLWLKLFALALAPAACEEFFFRGLFQNSLRQKVSATRAIIASAVVFGLFHVLVKDALMYERFVPSALMGIALGWVFERTGSVLPGMLLHVLHNGLLIFVAHFEDYFATWDILTEQHQHLPSALLVTAGITVVVAFGILLKLPQNKAEETS